MATTDTPAFKLGIRDIYWLIVIVAASVGNYYSLKAATAQNTYEINDVVRVQDKVNAVMDLKLQTLSIQVSKLEVELGDYIKSSNKSKK